MTSGRMVRDRNGAQVVREDGILQDGDMVMKGFALMDAVTRPPADERHALVRDKLGDVAAGKAAAWLDGAYGALAGDRVSAPPAAKASGLTPAQMQVARQGVKDALAEHSARTTPAKTATFDAARGAYDAMCSEMQDGWKSDLQRVADQGGVALHPRAAALLKDASGSQRAYAEMKQEMGEAWRRPAR